MIPIICIANIAEFVYFPVQIRGKKRKEAATSCASSRIAQSHTNWAELLIFSQLEHVQFNLSVCRQCNVCTHIYYVSSHFVVLVIYFTYLYNILVLLIIRNAAVKKQEGR